MVLLQLSPCYNPVSPKYLYDFFLVSISAITLNFFQQNDVGQMGVNNAVM